MSDSKKIEPTGSDSLLSDRPDRQESLPFPPTPSGSIGPLWVGDAVQDVIARQSGGLGWFRAHGTLTTSI